MASLPKLTFNKENVPASNVNDFLARLWVLMVGKFKDEVSYMGPTGKYFVHVAPTFPTDLSSLQGLALRAVEDDYLAKNKVYRKKVEASDDIKKEMWSYKMEFLVPGTVPRTRCESDPIECMRRNLKF
jgi:hypothetical protein